MDKESLVQIIQRAVQTEKDGNLFYSRAAGATRDPKAKKMFELLARDELYHVKIIEDLYRDLLTGGNIEAVKGYPIFEKRDENFREEISNSGSEADVLEQAIGDEMASKDFYREAAEVLEPGEEKEIFLDLMEMEEGHIRLLKAELDFLKKTGIYFDPTEFPVEGEKE